MCSETFLRLPEEKRQRFLDAAWEEFVRVPFAEASINKIVLKARVPRGSFYQYFESKDDLFAYLQQTVLEYLIAEYCRFMREADGNIFKTQIICFDRVAALGRAADPLFDRCLRVLRLNPGLLPQVAMEGKLMCHMLESVWDIIDASDLRSQEYEFVAHAFGLTLIALAVAVAACLDAPEQAEGHRRALLTQLDIIKNGSLATEPIKEAL